jgi:hydrogenase-4 component E
VTYLLVAFLVVLVAPLLTASWRLSLAGLGLQGLLLGAMLAQRGWPATWSGAVLLADLLLLRAWFAPRHLAGVMRRLGAPPRADVIPANLLSWTLAGALVLVGFRFAGLVHPEGGLVATHAAVAASALLLGFLILGTQAGPFAQVVGLLRLENAVALFELGSDHALPLPAQLGVSAVLLASVLLLGRFLARLGVAAPATAPARPGRARP